ncbi:MAG: cytochrome P450 [Actinophytocola sp.]|uniref:cytochrome P450 n=1 Tax=Actinophytocola sp. TaxID=1872138 RepID=UPI003C794300
MTTPSVPDIMSPEFNDNPYPSYQIFRDHHPVLWDERLGGFLVGRYADVERILKDSEVFSSRGWADQFGAVIGRTLLEMDGAEHVAHRRIISRFFHGHGLAEVATQSVAEMSSRLIDGFAESGSGDLSDLFDRRLPVGVISHILGLPLNDWERFQGWYRRYVAFFGNFANDPDIAAAGLSARDQLFDYFGDLIDQRRHVPTEDLISTLCTATVDGVRMTDAEIKSFSALLLTGGGETTEKALDLLICNLLDNPDQLAAVTADPELIKFALAESLRFSPVLHILTRETTEAVTLSGVTVPADTKVFPLIGATGRDPARFQDPDTFDIRRADLDVGRAFGGAADHLMFGGGRHFCVGALLARTEVETGMKDILSRLPNLRYQPDFRPSYTGIFARGPERIELRWDVR